MTKQTAALETKIVAGGCGITAILRDPETLLTLYETDVAPRRHVAEVIREARRWAKSQGLRIIKSDLPNREDDIMLRLMRNR